MNIAIKNAYLCASLLIVTTHTMASDGQITESENPTEYCVLETSVRGELGNLIIDHNLIIDPQYHSSSGDIFVAARLLSNPEDVWLLRKNKWLKLENPDDLPDIQYQSYTKLPLLAPITVFYNPADISELEQNVELLVGYGIRSETQTSVDSFNEMISSGRYRQVWRAPSKLVSPILGLSGISTICIETSKITHTINSVTVGLP